jgi:hypothetical protein
MIRAYNIQERHLSEKEKQATLDTERVLISIILISYLTSEGIPHICSLLPWSPSPLINLRTRFSLGGRAITPCVTKSLITVIRCLIE